MLDEYIEKVIENDLLHIFVDLFSKENKADKLRILDIIYNKASPETLAKLLHLVE